MSKEHLSTISVIIYVHELPPRINCNECEHSEDMSPVGSILMLRHQNKEHD